MNRYLCSGNITFVKNKRYEQVVLPNTTSLPSLPKEDAMKECHRISNGADFFVQQHSNNYTVCGVFKEKDGTNTQLQHTDDFQKDNFKYGTVCTTNMSLNLWK